MALRAQVETDAQSSQKLPRITLLCSDTVTGTNKSPVISALKAEIKILWPFPPRKLRSVYIESLLPCIQGAIIVLFSISVHLQGQQSGISSRVEAQL